MAETKQSTGDLDVLLHTEQTFPPPPEFAKQARNGRSAEPGHGSAVR